MPAFPLEADSEALQAGVIGRYPGWASLGREDNPDDWRALREVKQHRRRSACERMC